MITVGSDYYTLRLYIDNILHLCIKKDLLLGVQSWIDSPNRYVIEYCLAGGSIISHYDKFEVWKEILHLLNKEL